MVGRRVNVNAVDAQAESVAQDYALVISSGDGETPDAIRLVDGPAALAARPLVTVLTNQFAASPTEYGAILLHERVGADAPLAGTGTVPLSGGNGAITIGTVNEWHFYVLTNTSAFANAAFLTLLPPPLSVSDLAAVGGLTSLSALRPEADIDLYVSQEPGLTNLDRGAIARADKSLGRGGTETVVYTNAAPGTYYIGVKSETRQGAEYGFMAVFSRLPFSAMDGSGNLVLRGVPAPAPIPDGTPQQPGTASIVAIAPDSGAIRRVVVTNTLTHPSMGDLAGTLTHLDRAVVLNNHSPNQAVVGQTFIYDNSGEGDIAGAQPPDGPGTLRDFAGLSGGGQWLLTESDTTAGHAGTNDSLWLYLEAQPDLSSGAVVSILPGGCREDYLDLPPTATNLTAAVSLLSGTGPVSMQLGPAGSSDTVSAVVATNADGLLAIDKAANPPLNAGQYVLSLCNEGPDTVTLSNFVSQALDPTALTIAVFTSTNQVPIADNAVTVASMLVESNARLVSVDPAVRIRHPRVSDLVLHLVSPSGTRVLLDENRGGSSPDGMGLDIIVTNTVPVSSAGGAAASTNVFETGLTAGTITIFYQMYAAPDDMRVYYGGNLIYDSGLVSSSNTVNIPYGPGADTAVTIIMNEGNNWNPGTWWFYSVTALGPGFLYATFTEDTNLATAPIKFAPPPFTNAAPVIVNGVASNGIFVLPEESLAKLAGEPVSGQWKLEVQDTRASASGSAPALLSWRLWFVLADTFPTPITLEHHRAQTNSVAPGKIQYFSLDVPIWANFATNSVLWATAPVNLLFDQTHPPTGTNSAGDFCLLAHSTGGGAVLAAGSGNPPLVPGARCFLGVQNLNAAPVSFAFQSDFDVTPLAGDVPVTGTVLGEGLPRYYSYEPPRTPTSCPSNSST